MRGYRPVQFQGVLFDFGNTLFAHAPLPDTIARAAQARAVAVDAAALAARIDADAMHPDELVHPRDLDASVWTERWALLYGVADADHPGLGAEVFRLMHDPGEWIPFAATAATLRSLRTAGLAVGVVSNTGWDIRAAFGHHGLVGEVDTFVLSYEAGCTKPDPAIFRLAAERLDVQPGDLLMVGDDPRADGGAVTAGLPTVLLPPAAPGADNGLGLVSALVRGAPR